MEQKKIKNTLINILIKKGNKSKQEKFYNNFFINIKKKIKKNPHIILNNSITNISPKISLRFFKRKSIIFAFSPIKQVKISVKWLIDFSKNRKQIVKLNILEKNLFNEILETSNFKSKSLDKKRDLYQDIFKLKYILRKKLKKISLKRKKKKKYV